MMKIVLGILVSLISLVLCLVFVYPQPGGGENFTTSFFISLFYFFPFILFGVFALVGLSNKFIKIRLFFLNNIVLFAIISLYLIWAYFSWNYNLINDMFDIFYWVIVLSIAMILFFRLEPYVIKKFSQ